MAVLPRLEAKRDRQNRQRDQRAQEPRPLLGDRPSLVLLPQPEQGGSADRTTKQHTRHEAGHQVRALLGRLERVVFEELADPARLEGELRPDNRRAPEQSRNQNYAAADAVAILVGLRILLRRWRRRRVA